MRIGTFLGVAALGCAVIALSTLTDARHQARAQWTWTSPYPWCAQWGGKRGGSNECSYASFEQCQVSVFGAGGHCYPNPTYAGPPEEPRRLRSKRHRLN